MKNRSKHIVSIFTLIVFVFLAFGSFDEKSDGVIEGNENDRIEEIRINETLTQSQKDSLLKIEIEEELNNRKNQTISSINLVSRYEENEVKADNDFKDKIFYVEGRIEDIGKDILDNIYITLNGTSNSFRDVQCYIDDPEIVSKLNKGEFITILGTCNGLMMNVQMENCRVVKNLDELQRN